MKVFLACISLLALVPLCALAESYGRYNVTISNVPYRVGFVKEGHIFVYNAGTNNCFVSFAGHTDGGATYNSYIPLRPAAQYSTMEKYTFVSIVCNSNSLLNTQVDIGQE